MTCRAVIGEVDQRRALGKPRPADRGPSRHPDVVHRAGGAGFCKPTALPDRRHRYALLYCGVSDPDHSKHVIRDGTVERC